MHASQSLNQESIATRILLGSADSTLHTAIKALMVQSTMFSRIGALVADGDTVADLARLGCHAVDDAVFDCREHAESGDIIGAVDCLERVLSGHRIAKNLLSTIVEMADSKVGELAQLGVNLASSVLDDLGA